MAFHLEGYGPVDDSVDVWMLFQKDARGELGLYYGQLARELTDRLPAVAGRVRDAIHRGLRSDDAAERLAALHGAAQLRLDDVAADLDWISVNHKDEAASYPFFDVLASQHADARAKEILARVAPLPVADRDSENARARAFSAIDAAGGVEELRSAIARRDARRATALIGSLSGTPSFDAIVEQLRTSSQDERDFVVAAARDALSATVLASGYDRWLALATTLSAIPAELPARPVESAGSDRFRASLAALIAAESGAASPTPEPLPSAVVLSREVWVDSFLVPTGPPAELFAQVREHAIPVLISDALVDDVTQLLLVRGWSPTQAADAATRMRTLAKHAGATETEEQLASAAGLSEVYSVGPRTGSTLASIAFRPVSALITTLRR